MSVRAAAPSSNAGLLRPTTAGAVLFPIGTTAAAMAVVGLTSALVGLGDDTRAVLASLAVGSVCAVVAAVVVRRVHRPTKTDAASVFGMVTVAFVTLVAVTGAVHVLSGATSAVDVAVFEGAAAATTTAMTALDADELPRSLHWFRAMTQWVAGFGALVVALIVIPLASGSRELSRSQGTHSLNPAGARGLNRISAIYAAGTVTMAVGYAAAGMGAFDAVAHAFTTVSTGGLSTRSDSLAGFDSAAIEWVAGVGMALSGINLIAIWWAVRGDLATLRKGVELRAYLGVLLVATTVLFFWFGDEVRATEALRTAFVTVASAMSTTGFIVEPFQNFDAGALGVVFLLLAVGAMAGSAGGGFRYLRVLEALRFASRELRRQLHPSSVSVVKIGGRVISERSLERMHGYSVMFAATITIGAVAIAIADPAVGPVAALSMSLSALVTAGPAVGEASSPLVGDLGAVSHYALALVMFLGRLSIYPVLLTCVTVWQRSRRTWATREAAAR